MEKKIITRTDRILQNAFKINEVLGIKSSSSTGARRRLFKENIVTSTPKSRSRVS